MQWSRAAWGAQLALLVFVAPVCFGLHGVILPALGYFPALGSTDFSFEPVVMFLSTPGLKQAIIISLITGLTATCLSLCGAVFLLLLFWGHAEGRWLLRFISPIIAIPPTAVAAGLILFLAPSGWLIRLVSPEFTGFTAPPPWPLFPDPYGFGLVMTLCIKETPFILLLCLAALARLPATNMLKLTSSLGYGRLSGFVFILLPQIYQQIRLPLLAVLVFSVSVVELPLLLGPSLPPPLSVLVFQGFQDADLSMRFAASVGAVAQLLLVVIAWLIWRCAETVLARIASVWMWQGRRLRKLDRLILPAGLFTVLPIALFGLSLLALGLWSIAGRWPFSSNLPLFLTGRIWMQSGELFRVMGQSAVIAGAASILANGLMLIWLHCQSERLKKRDSRLSFLIYLPLLVPQISFLFGLQIGLSWAYLDGTYLSVTWVHALFILPYSYLILAPADAAFDNRYTQIGATFGLGSLSQLLRIKWMLMLPSISASVLVGIAVSAALYLPTLFAGAGRITTLTLEAVSQIQGGARAYLAVAVLLQLLLPLLFFVVVRLMLRMRFRKFADMNGGRS